MRIVWHKAALTDLEEATTYIDLDAPEASGKLAYVIIQAVERLAAFPQLGRPGHVPGARHLILPDWPYIIVYAVDGETLQILRIPHMRQRRASSARLR